MFLANYHTHSKFCDGVQEPEDYVCQAIKQKFQALGFSSHSPVPFMSKWNMSHADFPKYTASIQNLKQKYSEQIEIYLGLEIDFIQDSWGINSFKKSSLDYTIGAVHYLKPFRNRENFPIDSSPELFAKGINEIYNGEVQSLIAHYFSLLNEMITTQPPDIIAHIDLVKKFNANYQFFNEEEKWYRNMVFETLELAKDADCKIEINTKGKIVKFPGEIYPSTFILKRCKEIGVPVVINADAHKPENINYYFDESIKLMRQLDFREHYVLYQSKWQPMPL